MSGLSVLVAVAAAVAFLGSVLAAGPVGAVVLGAGFDGQPRRGAWIGVGAACAQAPYAALALYGAGALFESNPAWVRVIHLVSGFVLLGFAALVWRRSQAPSVAPAGRRGGSFALGFVTTLVNPAPVLAWSAVAAVLAAEGRVPEGSGGVVAFGLGAGAGAATAFSLLAWGAARLRERGGASLAERVIRLAAVVLVLLALDNFAGAAGLVP